MCMIIYRSILLRTINISDKICTENQNTHFMFNNFFSENRAFDEIMWKNTVELTGRRRLQHSTCALHAG
jgi:hypothetical protein